MSLRLFSVVLLLTLLSLFHVSLGQTTCQLMCTDLEMQCASDCTDDTCKQMCQGQQTTCLNNCNAPGQENGIIVELVQPQKGAAVGEDCESVCNDQMGTCDGGCDSSCSKQSDPDVCRQECEVNCQSAFEVCSEQCPQGAQVKVSKV